MSPFDDPEAIFNIITSALLAFNTLITVSNNVLTRSVKRRQKKVLDEVLRAAEEAEQRGQSCD